MTTIVLVEDQTIVRRGIVSLLATVSDIEVVAEAEDGAAGLEAIRQTKPDVVVSDIIMPKMSGIELTKALRAEPNNPPVILLTTFDEDPLFLQAIQAGASGFLLKDVSVDRLAEAIRTVKTGKPLFQPALTERVVKVVQEKGIAFDSLPNPETLTPRETDVLRLIAAGYSNREIATTLGMTEGSVKNHISNVLSKLGARDRTRAVLRAIEIGYI